MGRASPQALAEGTAKVGEVLVMPVLVGRLLSGCLFGKEEQLQKQSVWKGSLVIAGLGQAGWRGSGGTDQGPAVRGTRAPNPGQGASSSSCPRRCPSSPLLLTAQDTPPFLPQYLRALRTGIQQTWV